jgi:protein-S-isoprenylcysteine O-methyltransferase Ste14
MSQAAISKMTRVQLVVRAVIAPLVMFGFLFLLAGRWTYWQGWVYVSLNVLVLILMSTLLTRNKDLIEERLNPKEGMKGWDRVYFGISTPLYVIALILGGLDARFGWTSHLPLAVYLGAVVLFLAGQGIFMWARYTNNYFSSVVRIQIDRGQSVCKDGPYHYVRHPGYVGGFLFTAASGLLLGSWWAAIPQFLAALLIIWRTGLEDKTLQTELPGYAEYASETRYRLVPGVW